MPLMLSTISIEVYRKKEKKIGNDTENVFSLSEAGAGCGRSVMQGWKAPHSHSAEEKKHCAAPKPNKESSTSMSSSLSSL